MNKIEEINGNEIIDFMNSLSDNDNKELLDICCQGPYRFEKQEIMRDGRYKLSFSAYYNNWGTNQLIEDNHIVIHKDGVRCWLEEPFDGDESGDVLEVLLTKWLNTHKFSSDYKYHFECLIEESRDKLSSIGYGDIDIIEDIIKNLTKAKTLIK